MEKSWTVRQPLTRCRKAHSDGINKWEWSRVCRRIVEGDIESPTLGKGLLQSFLIFSSSFHVLPIFFKLTFYRTRWKWRACSQNTSSILKDAFISDRN